MKKKGGKGRESIILFLKGLSALLDLPCDVLYLNDRIGLDDLQNILFEKGIARSGEVRADSRVRGELCYKISSNYQRGQRKRQNAEKAHRVCNPSKPCRNTTNSDPNTPRAMALMFSISLVCVLDPHFDERKNCYVFRLSNNHIIVSKKNL